MTDIHGKYLYYRCIPLLFYTEQSDACNRMVVIQKLILVASGKSYVINGIRFLVSHLRQAQHQTTLGVAAPIVIPSFLCLTTKHAVTIADTIK